MRYGSGFSPGSLPCSATRLTRPATVRPCWPRSTRSNDRGREPIRSFSRSGCDRRGADARATAPRHEIRSRPKFPVGGISSTCCNTVPGRPSRWNGSARAAARLAGRLADRLGRVRAGPRNERSSPEVPVASRCWSRRNCRACRSAASQRPQPAGRARKKS